MKLMRIMIVCVSISSVIIGGPGLSTLGQSRPMIRRVLLLYKCQHRESLANMLSHGGSRSSIFCMNSTFSYSFFDNFIVFVRLVGPFRTKHPFCLVAIKAL